MVAVKVRRSLLKYFICRSAVMKIAIKLLKISPVFIYLQWLFVNLKTEIDDSLELPQRLSMLFNLSRDFLTQRRGTVEQDAESCSINLDVNKIEVNNSYWQVK